MCGHCGCGEKHEHVHADGTRHSHAHHDDHDHPATLVELQTRILAKNDALAARNRT
jgi:hydrogenase nickel incorporation protein HypB